MMFTTCLWTMIPNGLCRGGVDQNISVGKRFRKDTEMEMTPAKRLQHMVCNSAREFSDEEIIAMSMCADAWNDMQSNKVSEKWQSDFDRAWDSCDILRRDTTEMAARSWYTKGRVAESCARG